jgi:hypothetical protein
MTREVTSKQIKAEIAAMIASMAGESGWNEYGRGLVDGKLIAFRNVKNRISHLERKAAKS